MRNWTYCGVHNDSHYVETLNLDPVFTACKNKLQRLSQAARNLNSKHRQWGWGAECRAQPGPSTQVVCPCFGKWEGAGRCRGGGHSTGSGGNWAWLRQWQTSGREETQNAWTQPSPGCSCSSSFVPLAGASLHFLIFFLRIILVWFSLMWLPVFAGVSPSGGHQPALPGAFQG